MIAVLPAAGKGTRMSAVASGSKELLTVGGRSILEWVLREAAEAGAGEQIVVVSPAKSDLLALPGLTTALQEKATGLAPALLAANRLEPTLLLLPDTIFFPRSPSVRLVKALSQGYDIAIAVQPVAEQAVSRYGIVEWSRENGRIARILEKPQPSQTASRWAIAARFALSPRTLLFCKQRVAQLEDGNKEVDLPPLLSEAIAAGHAALAIPLEADEQRLDCGNPEGYRHACEVVDASR
ncbi:MAG TPA: sugar phosphate nucleotidyltransferase [Fimbriimonadaceae bacterium]|nr:sugar phosphate nucleotidyltransferase [Fimbriimonadaceae bacterium]